MFLPLLLEMVPGALGLVRAVRLIVVTRRYHAEVGVATRRRDVGTMGSPFGSRCGPAGERGRHVDAMERFSHITKHKRDKGSTGTPPHMTALAVRYTLTRGVDISAPPIEIPRYEGTRCSPVCHTPNHALRAPPSTEETVRPCVRGGERSFPPTVCVRSRGVLRESALPPPSLVGAGDEAVGRAVESRSHGHRVLGVRRLIRMVRKC